MRKSEAGHTFRFRELGGNSFLKTSLKVSNKPTQINTSNLTLKFTIDSKFKASVKTRKDLISVGSLAVGSTSSSPAMSPASSYLSSSPPPQVLTYLGSIPVKEEAVQSSDLNGISDLLESHLPTIDLSSPDLMTFDLDMEGFDHQMQPTVSSSLNNLDFNSSPFESSMSEWGSMELGLEDLL